MREDSEICKEQGKPIIRLFSTTACPHCLWVKDTFDSVAQEYVDSGQIVAYHWELDIKDDTLTEKDERYVMDSEVDLFADFNPRFTVPTFVFGCKYYRVGNGYYENPNKKEEILELEELEFRAVILELINEG
jgi:thioredoxin-related protein